MELKGIDTNVYVNLVHIYGMPATLNMVKRLMAVSKRAIPGASAISDIPFKTALSHDGLASGMSDKPNVHKRVSVKIPLYLVVCTYLQNPTYLDNDLHALK